MHEEVENTEQDFPYGIAKKECTSYSSTERQAIVECLYERIISGCVGKWEATLAILALDQLMPYLATKTLDVGTPAYIPITILDILAKTVHAALLAIIHPKKEDDDLADAKNNALRNTYASLLHFMSTADRLATNARKEEFFDDMTSGQASYTRAKIRGKLLNILKELSDITGSDSYLFVILAVMRKLNALYTELCNNPYDYVTDATQEEHAKLMELFAHSIEIVSKLYHETRSAIVKGEPYAISPEVSSLILQLQDKTHIESSPVGALLTGLFASMEDEEEQ